MLKDSIRKDGLPNISINANKTLDDCFFLDLDSTIND
jgi:hypothetical protein